MSTQSLLWSWLRRVNRHPIHEQLVLRGSLLTAHLLRHQPTLPARVPQDVDHLLLGPFDAVALAETVADICLLPDPHTRLHLQRTEVIWADTAFPGLRVHLWGEAAGQAPVAFQVDLAAGDPMVQPPEVQDLPGVGPVLACAPETLVAWKLHGLTEFGRGRWRAKDLYDLHVLSLGVPLDLQGLRKALPVAFTSRGDPVANLDDFRVRPGWGCSVSGQRKWRSFLRKNELDTDFLQARATVRALLSRLEEP